MFYRAHRIDIDYTSFSCHKLGSDPSTKSLLISKSFLIGILRSRPNTVLLFGSRALLDEYKH